MTAVPTVVTLPGGHVARYRRVGTGDPLLYLRSFVTPSGDDAFVERLAEHYDVVIPQAPGSVDLAEMTDLDNGHDLALYHDDLVRFLGFERVRVVGHSSGGLVATELAAHFPERVEAMALVAPFGLWAAEEPTADLGRLRPAKLFAQLSTTPDGAADGAVVDDYDADHIVAATQALTATLKFLWPFPDHNLARRLYRITAPTRIYWGREDTINPVGYAQRYAQAIAGATVEQMAGGHLLIQDAPAEMAERVSDFFATERASVPSRS